eukprot:288330-Prymnesium_polylepis.1
MMLQLAANGLVTGHPLLCPTTYRPTYWLNASQTDDNVPLYGLQVYEARSRSYVDRKPHTSTAIAALRRAKGVDCLPPS